MAFVWFWRFILILKYGKYIHNWKVFHLSNVRNLKSFRFILDKVVLECFFAFIKKKKKKLENKYKYCKNKFTFTKNNGT